jgi:hypothetical protein
MRSYESVELVDHLERVVAREFRVDQLFLRGESDFLEA